MPCLKPTKGRSTSLVIERLNPNRKEKDLTSIRQKVGIVFQFPEHQLFDETVEKDICFGPMNFGVSEAEAKVRARRLLSKWVYLRIFWKSRRLIYQVVK